MVPTSSAGILNNFDRTKVKEYDLQNLGSTTVCGDIFHHIIQEMGHTGHPGLVGYMYFLQYNSPASFPIIDARSATIINPRLKKSNEVQNLMTNVSFRQILMF